MPAEKMEPRVLQPLAVVPWHGMAVVALEGQPELVIMFGNKVVVQEGPHHWAFYRGGLTRDMKLNLVECLGFGDDANCVLGFLSVESPLSPPSVPEVH